MPCSDGGYGRAEASAEQQRRLDLVTRLLCEVCGTQQISPELAAWFEQHQQDDIARKRAEMGQRESDRQRLLRQQADIARRLQKLDGK